MDFIAEMVLGFVDWQLCKKIEAINIKDYRILRYRDDYRIFTQNSLDAELIVKQLTDILIGLGLRINPHKTIASSNIVRDSLKTDKRYWIGHKKSFKTLQEELLNLHALSEAYPNSGSLDKALSKFFDRIRGYTEIKKDTIVMISIVTDIMLKSPRVYPIASAILSKLLSFLQKDVEKIEIIRKIIKRFKQIPNTGYLELWLQRITLNFDYDFSYKERLCSKVINPNCVIWNSEWLKGDLKNLIDNANIVDKNKIQLLDFVIQKSEVELFHTSY